jgi:Fe-S-cluster containining protein
MLEFIRETRGDDLPFHYRCRHFGHDREGIPSCMIYDIRPRMCRDFPFYENEVHLHRDEPLSPYEGCGYNEDD